MADDNPQPSHQSKDSDGVRSSTIFAKVAQVILAVFAIGLIVDPFNSFQRIFKTARIKFDDVAIIYLTVGGYIVINMLFIIGYLLGDRVPKRTAIMFAAVGAFLHVVAGSVIVHNWRKLSGGYVNAENNALYPSKQYMDMMISGAVFTFADAMVFVLDIFLIYKSSD